MLRGGVGRNRWGKREGNHISFNTLGKGGARAVTRSLAEHEKREYFLEKFRSGWPLRTQTQSLSGEQTSLSEQRQS